MTYSAASDLTRRTTLSGLAAACLAACAPSGKSKAQLLRIGFQKNGLLLLAKRSGRLDRALSAPPGASARWLEFSSGPPLLEAMTVGSVDLGSTGDAPPIFAQAAGAPIVYVAMVRLSGAAGAILTPKGSGIATLADLRGKRFAFTRGSSAHNTAAAALESAGLTFADVQPIALAPADAATAFAQGGIDAWVIWDPYMTVAIQTQGARALPLPPNLVGGAAFFLANRDFAQAHGDVLAHALDALAAEGRWASAHRAEVAKLQAQATGLPLELLQDTVLRDDFTLTPLAPDIISRQQSSADRFARLGLIPRSVEIAQALWAGWKPA